MCEVGGVVPFVQLVVSLVEGGPTHAGKQSVKGPGQVEATVVLHGQPAVGEVEQDFAQWVAAHYMGTGLCQDQQGQKLSCAGILGSQGEGHPVLVVSLVDPVIQPLNSGDQITLV